MSEPRGCWSAVNQPVVVTHSNTDVHVADASTDIVSIKNCDKVVFLVNQGLGATGYATLEIQACDNFVGTTTANVPFHYRVSATSGGVRTGNPALGAFTACASTGYAPGAAVSYCLTVIEVDVDDIVAAGRNHTTAFDAVGVRLFSDEDDSTAVQGAIIAICVANRYQDDVNVPDLLS